MLTHNDVLGAHEPPGRFTVFQSQDRDETEAYATNLFCPHLFKLNNTDKQLHARIASAGLKQLSVTSIGFGANVLVEPGELPDFFLVQTTVAGAVEVASGRQSCVATPGMATVISPEQQTRMLWDKEGHFLSLKIDRDVMYAQLSTMVDEPIDDPLVFDLEMNLSEGQASAWQSGLQALYNLLRFGSSSQVDSAHNTMLENWLVSSLLQSQPHNYSSRLKNAGEQNWPVFLTRAVRYMETNFRSDITIRRLCGVSGVSERKLRSAFLKEIGTTPRRYLLQLRLIHVRETLASGRPQTTVTRVLSDSGVQHHGRFAGYYLERYGESPSDTLRNARIAM